MSLTATQHKKQNSYLLRLMDKLGICDDDGFEIITNDTTMHCRLMCNESYFRTNKCQLYSSSGSNSCLKCRKAPPLMTVSELKVKIELDYEQYRRDQSKRLKRGYTMSNKTGGLQWVMGFCPICQPAEEGEQKNLLNGKCRACHNNTKSADPNYTRKPYTRKSGNATTFTPPEGFMLVRNCSTITALMENAERNLRTLDAEMEITIKAGLSNAKPPVDYERFQRLLQRRKDLGTTQDDPAKAYVEAFDRMLMLLGDIQSGDI